MRRALSLALVLLAVRVASVRAQDNTVARAETLAEGGKYTEARALLTRWWQQEGERSRDADERARGLLLRGQLNAEPGAAAEQYLTIVLEHPRAAQAPEALLRLGQHYHVTRDYDRAQNYLKRLTSDYPYAQQRPTGLLYLARAQRAAGRAADACKTVENAITPSLDPELSALLKTEVDACGANVVNTTTAPPRSGAAPAATPTPTPPRTTTGERTPALAADAPARSNVQPEGSGAFALQSGAFRDVRGARTLAARLERAGYSARVVRARGTLALVRVGRFNTTQQAVEVARKIRAQGFTAVVVDDARLERPLQD